MADRVRFGWEPLERLLAEPNVKDLITAYWEELWPYKDVPVIVDWERLKRFEAAGVYKVWTARVGPTLAGFASFYVQPHVFAMTTIIAMDGGHFVNPAFRDTEARIGWRMWKTAKVALKELGAVMINVHDNASRPLMPFFLALDMEPRSVMFWGKL